MTTPNPSATTSLSASTGSPTQTSEPGSNAGSGVHSQVVVAVIGIVLGVITLSASAFVLIAVGRQRRGRPNLLPLRRNQNLERQGTGLASWRNGLVRLFTRGTDRFVNVFSRRRWRWNRLEDGDERRITPFLAESGPVKAGEKPDQLSPQDHQLTGSEDTLVTDFLRTERYQSDSSLLIAPSDPEKDVTDGYWGQIDLDSCELLLSTRLQFN
jgi:hypothetical protein